MAGPSTTKERTNPVTVKPFFVHPIIPSIPKELPMIVVALTFIANEVLMRIKTVQLEK